MWSMLGERAVDVLCWESFGSGWSGDCKNQLKLKDLRVFKPTMARSRFEPGGLDARHHLHVERDDSGVRVPNGDWIPADRQGLAICDATSAVFAMDVPWDKLDVVTWSWQKVLGGEAAHGMLALSHAL